MSTPRFAIITSSFNPDVTQGLRAGALAHLAEQGVKVAAEDEFAAPGAFEIPLLAQELARTGQYAGIICLGCVIKGDTAHFEFISLGATVGLMQAGLETRTPISFGILTTYTDEQAVVRSRSDGPDAAHNKGREAANACFSQFQTLQKIRARM